MEHFKRLCVAGSVCLLAFLLCQAIGSAQWTVAQSDLPEVLTPSVEPPPEPSIYVPTETPSVTPVPTHAATANITAPTAPNSQQNSISFERLIGGIPVLMVALLVPLLIVIAVLFYTLLRGEGEGEPSPEEAADETGSAPVVRRSHRGRYWRKRHIKR